MAKDYTYAYRNILDQSTKIQSEGVVVPLLPANINPAGQELLAYLRVLHNHVEAQDLNPIANTLVERALSDAEQFYTDVTGNAPDYEWIKKRIPRDLQGFILEIKEENLLGFGSISSKESWLSKISESFDKPDSLFFFVTDLDFGFWLVTLWTKVFFKEFNCNNFTSLLFFFKP